MEDQGEQSKGERSGGNERRRGVGKERRRGGQVEVVRLRGCLRGASMALG